MEELLQRLEQQEQAIKVLERRLEIKEETDATAAKSAGVVKASEKGFTVQSADGANNVKLRGVLHVDGRALLSEDDTIVDDQFLLRRVRPIVEGTVGGIYDFRFTPDFAQGRTVIQDAYVTGRFAPGFQVTGGKFKAPIGLERLQSASDIRFVERAYPTQLVTNRDIGLQVAGNLLEDRLAYQVAYLNGSNDGRSSEDFADVEVNDDKEWAGRIFAQPFANSDSFALRGFGFGIAGSYTSQEGDATQTLLPQYRTPAQSTFFKYRSAAVATGDRTRVAPQFYQSRIALGKVGDRAFVVHVPGEPRRRRVGENRTPDREAFADRIARCDLEALRQVLLARLEPEHRPGGDRGVGGRAGGAGSTDTLAARLQVSSLRPEPTWVP